MAKYRIVFSPKLDPSDSYFSAEKRVWGLWTHVSGTLTKISSEDCEKRLRKVLNLKRVTTKKLEA